MHKLLCLILPIIASITLATIVPSVGDYIYFIGGFFSCGLLNYEAGNLKFNKQKAR
jgi:uncharacterized membrane protein YoaK (UPF0700 family)